MSTDYSYLNVAFDAREAPEPLGAPSAAPRASGALSVSLALGLARHTLEGLTLTIVGEVSDLSDNPRYKAVYFTLADEGAALPCLMWRSSFDRLGIQIKSGMQVEVSGRFTLYAAKGRMQFDVRQLSLAGEGRLRAQVAALAERLSAQGLMRKDLKLPLPETPQTIALITSPQGKAVHDVLRTLRRRFSVAKVLLYGVNVEGKGAVEGLIQALEAAQTGDAEVILLVRGGGSYEDFMPFNSEELARAIAGARLPVVTGIGHEPDNCIADMVASLRASTPTAAAEAVVPEHTELTQRLVAQGSVLSRLLTRQLERTGYELNVLERSLPLASPEHLFAAQALTVEQAALRLEEAIPVGFATARARLTEAEARLRASSASAMALRQSDIRHSQLSLLHQGSKLLFAYQAVCAHNRQRLYLVGRPLTARPGANLAAAVAALDTLSPLAVLARGYSLSYTADGHIMRSVKDTRPGEMLTLQLADGSLSAEVKNTIAAPAATSVAAPAASSVATPRAVPTASTTKATSITHTTTKEA